MCVLYVCSKGTGENPHVLEAETWYSASMLWDNRGVTTARTSPSATDLICTLSLKTPSHLMMRKLKFREGNNPTKVTQLSEWRGSESPAQVCLSQRPVLFPLLHDTVMEKMQLEVK